MHLERESVKTGLVGTVGRHATSFESTFKDPFPKCEVSVFQPESLLTLRALFSPPQWLICMQDELASFPTVAPSFMNKDVLFPKPGAGSALGQKRARRKFQLFSPTLVLKFLQSVRPQNSWKIAKIAEGAVSDIVARAVPLYFPVGSLLSISNIYVAGRGLSHIVTEYPLTQLSYYMSHRA